MKSPRCWIGLLLLAAGAAAAQPSAVPAEVEQPRPFGHVLGDVLTQRVLLQQAGQAFEPARLPAPDRVGLWLERRAPRFQTDERGRWLVLDYQLINAPRSLSAIVLPAWRLDAASGAALAVPEWTLSVGPLTPEQPFARGDLQALRQDRPVADLPTEPLRRQLWSALAALAGVLLAWAGWWAWRNQREAERLPFAHAWQQMRVMSASDPQAWLALHRALNRSAGRVVHGATLPRLLAERPQLQPAQAQLEDFYRQSSHRFFAAGEAADFGLLELARRLRDIEKRHQR